jgi:hypothetical protein
VIDETLIQLSLKVLRYFIGFLESDSKRQQVRCRRVILRAAFEFKACMPLSPYETLLDAVCNVLAKPWEDAEISIAPRALSETLNPPRRLILKEQMIAKSRDQLKSETLVAVKRRQRTQQDGVGAL